MLSRVLIKRMCHTHSRSKCYENIHKLDSLRQDVNEVKQLVHAFHQPLQVIYFINVGWFTAATIYAVKAILF